MGVTQKQFGYRIGISNTYLSEVESEKKVPSEPLLLAIEYKFGVNKDWIIRGKGEKYVKERFPFTKKEEGLIKAIREMPEENKKIFMALVEKLQNK